MYFREMDREQLLQKYFVSESRATRVKSQRPCVPLNQNILNITKYRPGLMVVGGD